MKKFFMVLAAVAVAATSCVQSDDDFAVKGPQKSVQFSLANVISSRGVDAMIPVTTKVTLKDCVCGEVEITAENYSEYITIELPAGRTLADCVVFE